MAIEIDNSKFELLKQDGIRIAKLTQHTEFKRILESKVDINLKIAKVLTNAMNWKIEFSALKGAKFIVLFPVQSEAIKPPPAPIEESQ